MPTRAPKLTNPTVEVDGLASDPDYPITVFQGQGKNCAMLILTVEQARKLAADLLEAAN